MRLISHFLVTYFDEDGEEDEQRYLDVRSDLDSEDIPESLFSHIAPLLRVSRKNFGERSYMMGPEFLEEAEAEQVRALVNAFRTLRLIGADPVGEPVRIDQIIYAN